MVAADSMSAIEDMLRRHQKRLARRRRCPKMQSTPVIGRPVASPVMLIGQAPGAREVELRQPFAWTAGKTLLTRGLALIAAHPAWRAIQDGARA